MKIALVTGASAGIGLAVSRKLAAEGTRVALVARTEKTLREVAATLPGSEVFPLDVKDLDAVAALPARVVERMGAIDIVVNNAGVHHRGTMESREPRELAEMVQVNLAAPIVLCRAAVPLMRSPGSIVNVASLAGMVPVRHQAAYGATKAGLRAFSKAIRQELAGRVSVSVVSPGPVETGFLGEDLERIADIFFSQPMSTVDEVADAILAAIHDGAEEIAVPWASGKLCTLGYVSPFLLKALQPVMERRGARNKRAFIERRRSRSS